MKKSPALAAVVLALAPLAVHAQAPYLVKDINSIANSTPASSMPSGFIKFGSRIYFIAANVHGEAQLWSTDGTAGGTSQVSNIVTELDTRVQPRFAIVNGKLLFNAYDLQHGEELWTTDGTSAGTRLLADINSGRNSSSPGDRVVYHGKLIFAAGEPLNGREVWITDGTPAGTKSLKDVHAGSGGSDPLSFVVFNDTVYFGTGEGLWKTDGTESGTVLVKAGFLTSNLAVAGSRLFFHGGGNVWVSDGTEAGTQALVAVNGFGQNTMTPFGDKVLFAASAPPFGFEFWISDGTAAGTHIVRDIEPASSSVNQVPFITVVGNVGYFSAFTIKNGQELWKTDGTEAGTVMVKDIVPGSIGSGAAGLFAFGGKLYFVASATGARTSDTLWVSDGTEAGTRPLGSVRVSVSFDGPPTFTNIDGLLYFAGANALNGFEPWKSDGTEGGSTMIANVADDVAPSSFPHNLFAAGDLLYFEAWDGLGTPDPQVILPRSLFRSDGSAAGTVELTDLPPGSGSYVPAAGHSIYFKKGNELWTSDGTPAGTGRATALLSRFPLALTSISIAGNAIFGAVANGSQYETWATTTALDAPAVPLGVNASTFVDVAGRAMFFSGTSLWISDGTPGGTYAVADVGGGSTSTAIVVGGQLYFAANSKLWRSDGTPEGTTVVVKSLPGGLLSFVAAGNKLFFAANQALWFTDFTDAGTHSLGALVGGTVAGNVAATGDRVVFNSSDSTHGHELWVSDGTTEGTHLLVDLSTLSSFGSNPTDLASINGVVYFSAFDDVHGIEPWITDGTVQGTKLAADIEPGLAGWSQPQNFVKAGEHIFFSATTAATGTELWAFPLAPQLAIDDVRVTEGDSGTAPARFTVTLSSAPSQPVTVDYATSDGTATAGADYDAASGTLTFAAGETSKSIDVRVRGNVTTQSNRIFYVTLRNAAGAALAKPTGFAMIEDDDQAADLGLALDFSLYGDAAVVVKAANNGPSAASGIKMSTTVTPAANAGTFTCQPCIPTPQVLVPGATAPAFKYQNFGLQQYVTATVAARQRDPQPANNGIGWTTSSPVAMDALFLTPGTNATIWAWAFDSVHTTVSVSSSDPSVLTVPATAANPTLGKPFSFPVHGVGVGRATIRVFTSAGTIGTLTVDVVAPGTRPRWPGITRTTGDVSPFSSLPFDKSTLLTVEAGGTAPFTGATVTGTVVAAAGGQELGRVTLDGKSSLVRFSIYLPALGANAVSVAYSGDANFLPSTTTFTVTTTIGSATIAPSGVRHGDAATVNVTVTGSPFGTPTGTVTIGEAGIIATQQATLSATTTPGVAQATFTLTNLPAGAHTLSLTYSGDAKYRSGTQSFRLMDARTRAVRH
jgi:ELWxxDGT repeat protein